MTHAARKVCLALAALALTAPGTAGQVKPSCPAVGVSCVEAAWPGDQTAVFTASVAGGAVAGRVTFNWVVSAGTITSGQGTHAITGDINGLAGATVVAKVEVGGLPASCPRLASCTSQLARVCDGGRKLDEYGNIRFNDEKARLDNFAIELQNDPTAQGYIIAYGGRRGRAGEAQRRADRAKDYLVNTRGIDASRIVTVDGGFREDLTVELWAGVQGSTPPEATPTVEPSEAQLIPEAPRRPARQPQRRN